MMDERRKMINRCFELAEEARLRGDTPVGSLVVGATGDILAEAGEQNRTRDLFAHAEFLAIQQAVKNRQSNDLTGCKLYTTNEPCFLCSFAIRQTFISRVVMVKRTPGIGGVTSRYPILTASGINNWGAAPEIIVADESGIIRA